MERMQKLFSLIIPVSVLYLILVSSESYAQSRADLVIRNAKVITIDKDNRLAEAIAIKGELIIAVSSDSDIERYIEEAKTKVLDAKGRLVVPCGGEKIYRANEPSSTSITIILIEESIRWPIHILQNYHHDKKCGLW